MIGTALLASSISLALMKAWGHRPSRLRLAQARYRLGRLAGPTRGDLLLSEGLPIVDMPQAQPSPCWCCPPPMPDPPASRDRPPALPIPGPGDSRPG